MEPRLKNQSDSPKFGLSIRCPNIWPRTSAASRTDGSGLGLGGICPGDRCPTAGGGDKCPVFAIVWIVKL